MKKLRHIISIVLFSCLSIFNIAAKESDIDDQLGVFNSKTVQLLETRNKDFQNHREDASFILHGGNKQKLSAPKQNEIVIFVTQSSHKNNVEVNLGKNIRKIIPTAKSINIIQATKVQLRSSNTVTFNKGVQKVINAYASLIDRHYHVKNENDLSERELSNLNHPQRMKLFWGVSIGVFAIIALAWYQNFKIKH